MRYFGVQDNAHVPPLPSSALALVLVVFCLRHGRGCGVEEAASSTVSSAFIPHLTRKNVDDHPTDIVERLFGRSIHLLLSRVDLCYLVSDIFDRKHTHIRKHTHTHTQAHTHTRIHADTHTHTCSLRKYFSSMDAGIPWGVARL